MTSYAVIAGDRRGAHLDRGWTTPGVPPSERVGPSSTEQPSSTGPDTRPGGSGSSGRFGDRAYGAEELVAELGAAFWCAQFGLEQATRTDHAAYLGDWLAMLKQDARALVAACGHAQRAVDYLNDVAHWTPTVPVAVGASED